MLFVRIYALHIKMVSLITDIRNLCFKRPANIIISSPSRSGKTELVKRLIEYSVDLFDILPHRVVL